MKKPLLFILLSVLLAATAWLVESKVLHSSFQHTDISNFKRQFHSSEKKLNNYFKGIETFDTQNQPKDLSSLYNKEGICFFIFQDHKLTYWSDNQVVLPQDINALQDNSLIKTPTGWFYCRYKTDSTKQYVALLLLKTEYSLANKYLVNKFNTQFSLPSSIHFYTSSLGVGNDVLNSDGKFAFSLLFPKTLIFLKSEIILPLLLYAISFFLLLLSLFLYVKEIKSDKTKSITLIGISILLLTIRQVLLFYNWPHVFYQLEFFNPKLFAYSNFFPSLGDITVFTMLFAFVFLTSYIHINLSSLSIKKLARRYFPQLIMQFLFIALFIYTIWLFNSLIINSNISFEANQIMHITTHSIIGLLVITTYITICYLLVEKTLRFYLYPKGYKHFQISFYAILLICLAFASLIRFYINWPSIVVFAIAVSSGSYFGLVRNLRHNYLVITVLILLFASFSAYFIQRISEKKRDDEQKVIALRLASERDPVAENLFAEIRTNILKDTIIQHLVNEKTFRFDLLMPYIRQQYFNGYFEKYDFQLTVCRNEDSLRISPEDINVPCFSFFNTMIGTKGEKLPRSDFYYVNYANSRISYLGLLRYNTAHCGLTHLYIELDARLNSQELGYPDLLLDEKLSRQRLSENYSYARYYKEKLIAQSGKFPYNRTSNTYPIKNQEFSVATFNGYKHIFYRSDFQNIIILSRPAERFTNVLISFSYLFVFLLVLFNAALSIAYFKKLSSFISLNFEHKIRYSLAGMLLFSLLLVAGASAFYTSSQFKQKHNAQISEKMQSVYREMAQRLGFEDQKDASLSNLSQQNMEVLLRSFSNIFYSDINVYDPQGYLIASSRPEVFYKNFLSTCINREALEELTHNNRSEYIHYENIGSMRFMSAYMPIVNGEGAVIGFLNLPYFAKQSELWAELYNQLFTLLNFYILLMLIAVSVSVFISRRITQPLRWIQDRFSQIKLGDRTSKINYKGKDEIGALVEQYNRMVEELNRNMDLLAKSERESAWREMAKQIAHEIKNPLTPMKLSLQHLVRAWNDKVENWDDHLNRVTQTIIEQIDNLTSIANEFSNFAKMPKPNTVAIPISTIINDVIQLYSGSGTTIKYNKHTKTEPEIIADKEQITRVFINLVTNSLQAISPHKKGRINIDVFTNGTETIRIEIADNGTGISPAIGGKLFEPNFTTKSGGMGLGLAIVKNIIENTGGSIYYRSIQEEGTTFTIELPLAQKNSKTIEK